MSRAKVLRFFRYNLLSSRESQASTPFSFPCSKYSHHFPVCCQYTSCRQQSSGSSHDTTAKSSQSKGGTGAEDTAAGREGETMKSWQMHSYGGPSELQLSTRERIPTLNAPDEVLVKIHAASVNPIDLAMTRGYGAETINILRDLCPSASPSTIMEMPKKLAKYLLAPVAGNKSVIEFPLTLGRDFAGVVSRVGHGVKTDVRVGDEVYGVVGVQRQGSHAQYVVVTEDTIRRKPRNLSFTEAASIPYVGLTTWSALRVTGSFSNLAQKRFLVLGGSGGIGTFTIQYLKSQGATVTTTCSTDAVNLVSELGPDSVIDYKEGEAAITKIRSQAPFDCILHLSGPSTLNKSMELLSLLKPVSGQFITLSPPFLSNIDKHGIVGGAAKNLSDLLSSNLKSWTDAKAVTKWAFFIPNGEPLRKYAELIEKKEIVPVMHSVYKFENLPDAYKALEEGHLRGKVVVSMEQ